MQFLKQKQTDDCGPVALMNACIYFGRKLSYQRNIKKFKKISGHIEGYGTMPDLFEKALKKKKLFPFKLNKIGYIPETNEIQEYLKSGKGVILGISYEGWTHVGLIFKITTKYVYLVNWGGKAAKRRVKINIFKKWISQWSVIYVLEKC
jgi:hypothetical protein